MTVDAAQDRSSRQIRFRELGEDGQNRLAQARVAIVGCGALGTVQAELLARAGVGFLRLIDRDYIELSNLQLQSLYDEKDAAEALPKAAAAAARLKAVNSAIQIEAAIEDLTPASVEDLHDDVHLIMDGTDNFETRYLINDFSLSRNIPWNYDAAVGSYGLKMAVISGQTSCLRCLMPNPPGSAQQTSLNVAAWSVLFASLIVIPLGAVVGLFEFPLKSVFRLLLNSLMAMPTVVVGLLLYGLLSRQGLLGSLGLLFTAAAIVVGQSVLVIPVAANYALAVVQGADKAILPTAETLGATGLQGMWQLVREVRYGVIAEIIAGSGRVVSEVGVAMIPGGNTRMYTRTRTTATALESSEGEFATSLALGLLLMLIALAVNSLLTIAQVGQRA